MSGWLAIVNAVSGGHRRMSRTIAGVIDKLRTLARETTFSEYPGHARRLASAATGYSGVICVGGDGTLLEISTSPARSHKILSLPFRRRATPSSRAMLRRRTLSWCNAAHRLCAR
jgi:diacylglycerol kinase family enzyme